MSDEKLERALDQIAAGRSPRDELFGLEPEEQRLVAIAQLLRGSVETGPTPTFERDLGARLKSRPRRLSRRSAFMTGAAALAAGIAGGIGLDRLFGGGGSNGWVQVASAQELTEGVPKAFKVDEVQGFVVRRHGTVKGLSRLCTDIGCPLNFSRTKGSLVCPCHPAEFNLDGVNVVAPPGRYGDGLPPLPHIKVRVDGDSVLVKTT